MRRVLGWLIVCAAVVWVLVTAAVLFSADASGCADRTIEEC